MKRKRRTPYIFQSSFFSSVVEFTVYELVAYLERIIDDLQIVAEGLLDKKLVKAVYAIGRRAAKIEDKDPRDLRISTVYAKFFGKSADEKEKKRRAR